MNRRDFLTMRRRSAAGTVVLSCEQLYMRYADACAAGTATEFFEHLGHARPLVPHAADAFQYRRYRPRWQVRDKPLRLAETHEVPLGLKGGVRHVAAPGDLAAQLHGIKGALHRPAGIGFAASCSL